MKEFDSVVDTVSSDLMQYLSYYELDIAMEVNDFGNLAAVFEAVAGHKARGNPKVRPLIVGMYKH